MRMKSSWADLVTLIRRHMKEMIFHSTIWGHSKGIHSVQVRREASPEPGHASTMISDFPASRAVKINFCCSSHLVQPYCITEAHTSQDKNTCTTSHAPSPFLPQLLPTLSFTQPVIYSFLHYGLACTFWDFLQTESLIIYFICGASFT